MSDEWQKRLACPRHSSSVRLHERSESGCPRPWARGLDLRDRLACGLRASFGRIPVPGPELDKGEVRETLREPDVLAALSVPALLLGVARAGGIEVVDAVEIDECEQALGRVGTGPLLARAPAIAQLPLLPVSAEALCPSPVEVDGRERRGVPLGIECLYCRASSSERPRGIERYADVDELRMDLRQEPGVVAGGIERELELLDRAWMPGDPGDVAEQEERPSAERSDGRACREPLRESPASLQVAQHPESGRLAQLPPCALLGELFRRQPACAGEELGRSLLRAPRRRPRRGLLELGGDRLVWIGRRERKVADPVLGVGDDLREALVQPASPLRARAAVDRRGQQRMGEANASCIGREYAGLLGLEQAGTVFLGRDRRDKELSRGSGQSSRGEAHLAAAPGELFDALARERLNVARDRQRPTSRDRPPVSAESAGDLEREERIPSRGLREPGKRRAWRHRAEPV